MRFLGLLSAVFVLLLPGHSTAQGFLEYVSEADRFGVSFFAEPEVRDITYTSEYEVQFPARLYTVHDEQGFYSVTVVDFRDAQSIHTEMLKDKSPTEINTFPNRWISDQRASVARAASQFRQRGGEITYDAWAHVENVEGHQLHMLNADGTRTFAGIYLHGKARFLYILEATVPQSAPPPVQFQQSLRFFDEEGARIRYALEPDGTTTRIPR